MSEESLSTVGLGIEEFDLRSTMEMENTIGNIEHLPIEITLKIYANFVTDSACTALPQIVTKEGTVHIECIT